MEIADRDHKMNGICPVVCGIIDVLVQGPDIRTAFGGEARVRDEPDRLPFPFRGSG
jgi:hypothetical protein